MWNDVLALEMPVRVLNDALGLRDCGDRVRMHMRDVAELYGGSIMLKESDDLGGLLAVLRLPRVAGK